MVDKSEKVVLLARLGYGVRGLVYILLGYLAISSASERQVSNGTRGSLEYLQSIPGGTAILSLAAVGLFGYALYKVIAATFDTEHYGHDAKGIGHRAAYFGSAFIYIGLAWTALRLAEGARVDSSDQTREWAAKALTFDLGPVALGIAAIGLLVGAGVQAKNAIDKGFMKHISSRAPTGTCWIGRLGLSARAVVFAFMAWSLARSAWFANSAEVRSLGQALMDFREMGFVFTVVAAGLVLFGVFSVITARYRIIPDPDPHLNLHLRAA
jgi:hypothetical protein